MEKPLLLDSQQIADYWPHVTNLYMRSSKATGHNNGTVSEAWECRIRRRVTMKGKETSSSGKRQRVSKDELLGDIDECKVRLNLISYTKHVTSQEACGGPGFGNCHCLAEWLYIEPTGSTVQSNAQHTHPLDVLDAFKRSDAIMYFCKVKVEEGQYSYAAVLRWVQEKYGHITSQLKHLNKADVANVARPWRLQNREVELRPEIVEETDPARQHKECLDSIQTTSVEQLRKALTEVCKAYPNAVDIIAPFMKKPPEEQDQATKPIIQGYDINIPSPGRPRKRKLACDPPSPSAPPNGPPGSNPAAAQGIPVPSPYSHSYPQPPPNNAVRGFRVSIPNPTVGHPATMNGISSSLAPPPPPYPVAAPPLHILQYPLPSASRPRVARHEAPAQITHQTPASGSPPSQDRPSWAQPVSRQPGGALESPYGAGAPRAAARDPTPDIEQQLREELRI